MTAQKNTALAIGSFIVGAIVLVFIALLFFSGGKIFEAKETVVMYFEGSVQGLQIGAPIKLKGVSIGEITDISINYQGASALTVDGTSFPQTNTVVTVVTGELVMSKLEASNIDAISDFVDRAISDGMRAQLNFQSLLTGLLYVDLDFSPGSPVKLYNYQSEYIELPTVVTEFEKISRDFRDLNLKELAANINDLATAMSDFVKSGKVEKAITNFDQASNSVKQTSDKFDKTLTNLANDTDKTLSKMDTLLDQLNSDAPEITKTLKSNLHTLNESLNSFTQTANNMSLFFEQDSKFVNEINATLGDISRAARSFRRLNETIEQEPQALIRGKNSGMDRE